MRKQVCIQRGASRDDGTPGRLTIAGSDFSCITLELSDRGNANMISCIPCGKYLVRWTNHKEHGFCWEVLNVTGRTAILIHSANLAGNTEQGYCKQLLGCIALGQSLEIFKAGTSFHVEGPHGPEVEQLSRDQRGITESKKTLMAFNAIMGTEDFDLTILAPRDE